MKTAREFAIELAATDLGSNIIAIEERDREIHVAALREAAAWFGTQYSTVGAVVAADVLRDMANREKCGE